MKRVTDVSNIINIIQQIIFISSFSFLTSRNWRVGCLKFVAINYKTKETFPSTQCSSYRASLLRTKITQTLFAFKTLNFHQNIYTTNIEVERRVADSSYVFSGYYNLTSNILKVYNAHQKKLV